MMSTPSTGLDVVVVGAGIAGLCAAASLRRAGHRVRVLERSALDNEIGAAINVPPNAGRVLAAWGIDLRAARFVVARRIVTALGATTAELGAVPLGDWVAQAYGAPLHFAHRVDLHEALRALAIGPAGPGVPATLQLGSHVVAYVPPPSPSLLHA